MKENDKEKFLANAINMARTFYDYNFHISDRGDIPYGTLGYSSLTMNHLNKTLPPFCDQAEPKWNKVIGEFLEDKRERLQLYRNVKLLLGDPETGFYYIGRYKVLVKEIGETTGLASIEGIIRIISLPGMQSFHFILFHKDPFL
jgi:hypothetical protein